jgi:nucleoside-diphosphate-sugar epimerase
MMRLPAPRATISTFVIGKDSHLSSRLAATIPNTTLISARELMADGNLLAARQGTGPIRIVVNAFRRSTKVRDLQCSEEYVAEAMAPLARLLDVCDHLPVERLIYTSSASVYGGNEHCAETAAPAVRDVHAALKLAAEILVESKCRAAGHPYCVARVFNMFGERDRFSVVARIIDAVRSGGEVQLINSGRAIRDYIYVGDVARAYACLLNLAELPPIVNVASGRGTSVADILRHLRSAGVAVSTRSIDAVELPYSVGEVARLRKLIDVDSFLPVERFVVAQCAVDTRHAGRPEG